MTSPGYCIDQLSDEPLLVIPVEDTSKYSTKPLKWIRYATAAVLGSEGHLLKYAHDEDGIDVTLDMEDESPSEREIAFQPTSPIKFVDKDISYVSVSDITQNTEGQERFRNKVEERDEYTLSAGFEPFMGSVSHIIPYSKGSEVKYIRAVCKWRNGSEDPELSDIDDLRNGLLLDCCAHRIFGIGQLGILHTPNFALSINEVLPPITKDHKDPFRFTPHWFSREEIAERGREAFEVYTQDFSYPTIIDGWPTNWPPAFLFDFNYGVAVARLYGNVSAMNTLSNKFKSRYYPGSDCVKIRDLARGEIQSRRKERQGEHASCQISNAVDNVLCLSMLFNPRAIEKMEDKCRESQDRRQDQIVEKVNAWRVDIGTDNLHHAE